MSNIYDDIIAECIRNGEAIANTIEDYYNKNSAHHPDFYEELKATAQKSPGLPPAKIKTLTNFCDIGIRKKKVQEILHFLQNEKRATWSTIRKNINIADSTDGDKIIINLLLQTGKVRTENSSGSLTIYVYVEDSHTEAEKGQSTTIITTGNNSQVNIGDNIEKNTVKQSNDEKQDAIKTRFDDFVNWVKDHKLFWPILVLVIVLGFVVTFLANLKTISSPNEGKSPQTENVNGSENKTPSSKETELRKDSSLVDEGEPPQDLDSPEKGNTTKPNDPTPPNPRPVNPTINQQAQLAQDISSLFTGLQNDFGNKKGIMLAPGYWKSSKIPVGANDCNIYTYGADSLACVTQFYFGGNEQSAIASFNEVDKAISSLGEKTIENVPGKYQKVMVHSKDNYAILIRFKRSGTYYVILSIQKGTNVRHISGLQ